MRIITLSLFSLLMLNACKENKQDTLKNTMEYASTTAPETLQESEWIVLFDGSNTDAWHEYGKEDDEFPDSWKIEGDALVFHPVKGEKHNIVTDDEFESFELSLEWKIAEGGNSGVMWGVQESEDYSEPYYTGPEIQVLDNQRHPDANVGGKTHQAGALYDMVEPSVDVSTPAGEWNTYIIRIDRKENKGTVIHNGTLITTFPLEGEAWNTMVANSKFADWKDFGKFKKGKIALQDHSDVVAYRNIKIKKL